MSQSLAEQSNHVAYTPYPTYDTDIMTRVIFRIGKLNLTETEFSVSNVCELSNQLNIAEKVQSGISVDRDRQTCMNGNPISGT